MKQLGEYDYKTKELNEVILPASIAIVVDNTILPHLFNHDKSNNALGLYPDKHNTHTLHLQHIHVTHDGYKSTDRQ